jgi:3-carboxy-cis,cis-muconate cycloisomerase
VAVLSASCLLIAERVVRESVVYPERMAANLALDQGRIMAEAYMFQLAPELGREGAHDLVYLAAATSKARGIGLREALVEIAPGLDGTAEIDPSDYVGQSPEEARRAVADWRRGSTG